MSEEDAAEKEHEPSQKRLDEARERGEVPRSPDLATAASYAGLLIAGATVGGASLMKLGSLGTVLIDQSDALSRQVLGGGTAPLAGLLSAMAVATLPFFLLPAAMALVALTGQRALVFTPANLAPRLSRISPIAAAGQKFGRKGLFEFGKSFVKLVVVSGVLAVFLTLRLSDIVATLHLGPGQATLVLLSLLLQFLAIILGISLAIGALDYLFQRAEHLRRNRMSRQELMDELKQSEGDPHMKAQRRQRGVEIATNRMLADVPGADVVIVNPTHYAVALKWNRFDRTAPICVAKGVDAVAARIREKAAEAGVPLHRDPPTARALYASVEIGREIRPEHYRAVATAIRFAEAMRAKARGRR